MRNIIDRLKEPTPYFFQIIRNIGALIATTAAFFIGLQKAGFDLPEWIDKTLNFYTLTEGITIVFISQLTSICRNQYGQFDQEQKNEFLQNKTNFKNGKHPILVNDDRQTKT